MEKTFISFKNMSYLFDLKCYFLDAETEARKNPGRIINEFTKYLQLTNSKKDSVISSSPKI